MCREGEQDVDQQLAARHALRARQRVEPRPYTLPQPSTRARGLGADEIPAGEVDEVGAERARAVRPAECPPLARGALGLGRLAFGSMKSVST